MDSKWVLYCTVAYSLDCEGLNESTVDWEEEHRVSPPAGVILWCNQTAHGDMNVRIHRQIRRRDKRRMCALCRLALGVNAESAGRDRFVIASMLGCLALRIHPSLDHAQHSFPVPPPAASLQTARHQSGHPRNPHNHGIESPPLFPIDDDCLHLRHGHHALLRN